MTEDAQSGTENSQLPEQDCMVCEGCDRFFEQHHDTLTLEKGDYCPRCGTQFESGPVGMTYTEQYEWIQEHDVYAD